MGPPSMVHKANSSSVAVSPSPSAPVTIHGNRPARHADGDKDDPIDVGSSPPLLVSMELFNYFNPRTRVVDKWVNVMAAHPCYLEPFLRAHTFVMNGDGPLPYNIRHYIALMAAARHRNVYLVSRQKQEFLAYDGDRRWLMGLDFVPKKLRDLNEVNKILAHRPWQMTAGHIQRLTRSLDENWSISEVCHAIVILTHFHALTSLSWASGITEDDEDHDGHVHRKAEVTKVVVADVVVPNKAVSSPIAIGKGSDVGDGVGVVSAASPPSLTIIGRTGQDSPPLNPHPSSPPSEASVEVLMKKMQSISQQNTVSSSVTSDKSPEELQKVFEKVEISMMIPSSTPPKEVLKEKDVNVGAEVGSPPPPVTSTGRSSIPTGSTTTDYSSYSCSPSTGIHYLFGNRAAGASSATPTPTASTNDENQVTSDMSRFILDADFGYCDFYRRGESSEYPTFRIQDCSWDDHGFSLINTFYQDVGNLLDDKFKKTQNLTYYTMGRRTNVDTSMFRRAIWNYIQCIYGIRHDDYDYREVNELLTRDLKTYIKNVCCFPHRVRRDDGDRVMPEFWRSEKIHVNLMIEEARMQAALLYALRAVMQFMT